MPERENPSNWMANARTRLASRRAEKPATKAGQIRALWPEIEAALSVGQSAKSICRWLEEDAGITMGVTSLTSYISRIRRREKANRWPEYSPPQSVRAHTERMAESSILDFSEASPITAAPASKAPEDPLAQAMRALSRPRMDIRKIHNDGDPKGRNLI